MTRSVDGSLHGAKICVDARYLAHPGMGINRYLIALLEVLDAAGAELILVVDERFRADGEQPEEVKPFLRSTVRLSGVGFFWEQLSLPRFLRRCRPEAYIAPANRGIPLAPLRGTPTVLVVHDLIPLVLWRTYLLNRPRFALGFVTSQATALLRGSLVVAVSRSTADDIWRLSRRRALVVYRPGLPVRPERPEPVPLLADVSRYVVYNGGADPRKQVPLLIEAFREVQAAEPGLALVLVGPGYERFRPQIAALGLDDSVILTGLVSEAEKMTVVAGASALVMPSLYEGYGLPIAEGFVCGVPVVTSGRGALAEMSGDAAVLVDPTSVPSIARGIHAAIDPQNREVLTRRGAQQLKSLVEKDASGVKLLLESIAGLIRKRPPR